MSCNRCLVVSLNRFNRGANCTALSYNGLTIRYRRRTLIPGSRSGLVIAFRSYWDTGLANCVVVSGSQIPSLWLDIARVPCEFNFRILPLWCLLNSRHGCSWADILLDALKSHASLASWVNGGPSQESKILFDGGHAGFIILIFWVPYTTLTSRLDLLNRRTDPGRSSKLYGLGKL
jgi:hypothetical protein